jgi:hypothetical protein
MAANCAVERAETCALLSAAILPVLSLETSRPASALVVIALTSSAVKVARLAEVRALSCVDERPAIWVFVSAPALSVLRAARAAVERPATALAAIALISSVEKRASSSLLSVPTWAELRPETCSDVRP